VILVITHDKTRRQVAIRAKKELETVGANILGVVINRRKHYIPEWIYRRL
jgi:Mrp family chromosome partitioning ATPase